MTKPSAHQLIVLSSLGLTRTSQCPTSIDGKGDGWFNCPNGYRKDTAAAMVRKGHAELVIVNHCPYMRVTAAGKAAYEAAKQVVA